MMALILGVWLYGFVGLGMGILLGVAGRWLLQRRAEQQDSRLLSLPPAPRLPGPSTPWPGWLAAATGAGFAVLGLRYGLSTQTVIISAYFSVFVLIFVLDLGYRWVPNALLLPTAILVLTVSALTGHPPLSRALLGGVAGFVGFYLIAIAYRGALGAGDVKLAGLIGLMTGFPGVVTALSIGILMGGGGAVLLLVSGQATRKSYIPYAPFLVAGALLTLLFGTQIASRFSILSGW